MKSYKFNINGNKYDVTIDSTEGNLACVTVNGTPFQVEMEDTLTAPVQAAPVQNLTEPQTSATASSVIQKPSAQPSVAPTARTADSGTAVTSPLPGVIIALKVNIEDNVKAGQEIAILEAMKMENSIEATRDGIIAAVHVSKGDSILEGAPIVTIQ